MLGLCACVVCVVMWSVSEVVLVPYVVGAVTVLLFVLDVSILSECEGDGNAGVGDEYVGGTRSSDNVYSAADLLLGMSVARGMRGVGGVCEMCMSWGGHWIRGLGLACGGVWFGIGSGRVVVCEL